MRRSAELTGVVTGANRDNGIGLAVVRALPNRGAARAVGTYRDEANAAPLLALSRSLQNVLATALDVTVDDSVAAFGDWCGRELGRVDLFVNNASLGDAPGTVINGSLDELEHQLHTHAFGMLRVSRALSPLMERGAVILNVSSGLGSITRMRGEWAFYSAAKALQNALTRQLAGALERDGIIVCAIAPGWVATSLSGHGAPLTTEQSAADLVDLAIGATASASGTFRDHDGSSLPWEAAR